MKSKDAISDYQPVSPTTVEIDVSFGLKVRKFAKVTTLTQYKSTSLIVATLSSGHMVVIDVQRNRVMSTTKVHKGNITSSCFLENFEHFATGSGGFGKHQDNCINIYRVYEVLGDLFVKKVHGITNAHGRAHGVMCIRSSNNQGDRTLFSCGYQDDGRVRVWDFIERYTLAEAMSQYFNHRDTIYQMHLISFDSGKPDEDEDANRSKI